MFLQLLDRTETLRYYHPENTDTYLGSTLIREDIFDLYLDNKGWIVGRFGNNSQDYLADYMETIKAKDGILFIGKLAAVDYIRQTARKILDT